MVLSLHRRAIAIVGAIAEKEGIPARRRIRYGNSFDWLPAMIGGSIYLLLCRLGSAADPPELETY